MKHFLQTTQYCLECGAEIKPEDFWISGCCSNKCLSMLRGDDWDHDEPTDDESEDHDE